MPNKLSRFWQELKRRNVVRVITVYAGAAFVIIELINNITEPLRLPGWTPAFVIVLLAIGFPVVIIFSWIYDVHPEEGMVKTEAAREDRSEEPLARSNSWKIASYISFVVIVGLIALNIFGGREGPGIDESLENSIAVLIFNNYSGDPGQDIMCEGLTEEIIKNLYKMASFDEVRPLNSVKQFRVSELRAKEIGLVLDVNYVLAGSYKKIGSELIITPQLIEAMNDRVIWSEDYNKPYSEIMGIPGDIALKIAKNLKAFISEDVQQSIDRMPTDNIEAYEYLRQAMNAEASLSLDQRMELAEKAIELDPDYADAYAWIGTLIIQQANWTGNSEVQSVIFEAERYTDNAIEIDPYNVRANWVLAAINLFVKWDYVKVFSIISEFGTYFRSDSTLVWGPALFYQRMGMFDEALALFKEDSYEGIRTHILSGDTGYARKLISRRNILDDHHPEWAEFYIYFQEYDSALYCFESMMADGFQSLSVPRFQADMAVAYYKTGNITRAKSLLNKIIQRSDTTASQSPAYFLGWYYSWVGQPDSAFFWLDKAVKNRSMEIPWLKVDPAFESLTEDPRYRDLYARSGHKAFDDYMARRKQ